MWCSSTVESIEKGRVLSVSVTVTAASLLTGVDMWSDLCRGTSCTLTLQPSGMALVHVGRCNLLEQTFLQCDSLLPPPPPPPPLFYTHTHRPQIHKLRLRGLLSCCCSSSSLHPHNLSSLGRFINGPQLLRPRQWLAPSTTYPLHPFACVMDVLLSWRTESNSWREGGERRTVHVSGYKHNGNLCNLSCLTLQTEYKGREQEQHIDRGNKGSAHSHPLV